MISRGMFSKNRFTMITLNALAPAGSQIAQYEFSSEMPTIGRSSTVRNSGTSSTTGGTNSVISTKIGDERCVPRLEDAEHVAAGERHEQLAQPRPEGDAQRVEEVLADLGVVPRRGDVLEVESVRPQRHRSAQDVAGRGRRRLEQPQQRTEPDDHQEHQQQHVGGTERGAHQRPARGRGRRPRPVRRSTRGVAGAGRSPARRSDAGGRSSSCGNEALIDRSRRAWRGSTPP